MRISDWSSDVCSSDLLLHLLAALRGARRLGIDGRDPMPRGVERSERRHRKGRRSHEGDAHGEGLWRRLRRRAREMAGDRSEEHTSELQSLMRISYAVFCLKKKKKNNKKR